jgi:polyhydroxyalkanoate synthesis regulator phasin
MNKYEQLIEHILNEDEQAARALFHQLVVEKSRDIYESLMDEELGGNQAQSFVQDITQQDDQAQDMGLGEDDMEGGDIELDGGDMDGDEFGDEETFGGDDDMGGEAGEHAEITSKLDDLEAQLADLKAMLGDEGEEGGEDFGDDEGGEAGESDFDMDGGEEPTSGSGSAQGEEEGMMETMSGSGMSGSGMSGSGKMESANLFAKKGSGMSGSGKSGSGKSGSGTSIGKSGSGKSGSGKMESTTRRKTEVEIMKEYVDKIGEIYSQEPAKGEGKTVGTGGDAPAVNHKSISLDKGPDFGGTNENIVSGKGDNQNPDGKAFKAPSNEYTKGRGDLPGAGQFKNVPGGNAGKTAFKDKTAGHGADKKSGPEGKLVGADGSRPINKTSVQKQNTGAK